MTSFIDDYANQRNLPAEATRGGADKALPEYTKTFRK